MQDTHEPETPDQVVAANILRLRGDRSRATLARQLSEQTGEHWPEARLIDLEGKRSPNAPPRPARWSELVALALVFEVRLAELVLPEQGTIMCVASPTLRVDLPYLPNIDDVDAVDHLYFDRDETAAVLFGMPTEYLVNPQVAQRAAANAGITGREMRALVQQVAELRDEMATALANVTVPVHASPSDVTVQVHVPPLEQGND